MSSSVVTMRCPSCNAPLPAGSSNKIEIVCQYCGQVVYNQRTGLSDSKPLNVSYLYEPLFEDKDCYSTLINELVWTNFVPVDIFDTIVVEEIRHNMYPIYVFNVNWSANWSAVFSQGASHEETTYDNNGRQTGTRTVYETQYRDANGTSASDCRVILSGLSDGFANQSEICANHLYFSSEDFLKECAKDPDLIPLEEKYILDVDREVLSSWNIIEPDTDDEDAWKKGGEDALSEYVDAGVRNDIRSMSNDWLTDRKNYTYRYSKGEGHCVLIPIWEIDFRYGEKNYTASVATHFGGEAYMEDYPKDETVEGLKEKTDEEISSYKISRTVGYVFFGIFAALAILFLTLPSFSENRVAFCAMLVLAIVSWVFTRNVQRKKLNLENNFKNKLWDDKVKRKNAAEKRFGIKVGIGEEPEKQTMEYWVDVLVYVLFGVVFFIAIMQGLFVSINHKQHTRSQSTCQPSTNTAIRNNNNTTTTYQQPAKSTNNTSQKTVVSSLENGTSNVHAEIRQVLNQWVKYHNEQDVTELASLYNDQVEYYLANYSNNQVYNSKKKALDKNPQFQMEVSNVKVDEYSSYWEVTFDKKVWFNPNNAAKIYPSYLHVKKIDGAWKIVTEGDLVTDGNLGKKNNQSYQSGHYVVINGTELRLRLGPSTSADTFKWSDGSNRHPNKGEKYRYLGESDDFYKIDYKGHELWVSKQYTYLE